MAHPLTDTGLGQDHEGRKTESLDLFLAGSIFFDIVFTGLPTDPSPGTEVWAKGMGSLPVGQRT